MSSSEIKKQLVHWYGGNESDWKRISKKKKGSYDVRTFENKKLSLTKEIVSSEDGYYLKPEYFPTGEFWIYINQENIDIDNIDESKSYFDENLRDDLDYGNPAVVLKAPGGDFWYDQHSSQLIEEYFGVKDFCSKFEEPCENLNIVYHDIPLKDIRESLEKVGMVFLGYKTNEEYTDPVSHSTNFNSMEEVMVQVNGEYFELFPYDSKEYEHVVEELPWEVLSETIIGDTKTLKLKLGNTVATIIDDGSRWMKIKDDPSFKWYFYIDEYGREDGEFGFGVIRDNKLEVNPLKYNEYGFHLCSTTFDLDPSFEEVSEMRIEIDHSKYPTKEILIEYLISKGLEYKKEFDTK